MMTTRTRTEPENKSEKCTRFHQHSSEQNNSIFSPIPTAILDPKQYLLRETLCDQCMQACLWRWNRQWSFRHIPFDCRAVRFPWEWSYDEETDDIHCLVEWCNCLVSPLDLVSTHVEMEGNSLNFSQSFFQLEFVEEPCFYGGLDIVPNHPTKNNNTNRNESS